jgi:imidazolonepropionase
MNAPADVEALPPGDLVIRHIGQLVTNDPAHGGTLGIIWNAAVLIVDGRVDWVGIDRELPPDVGDLPVVDAAGACVVPGFVDAHTHVVFAGDRTEEFGQRLTGVSYEEIHAAGGGINATVAATRRADRRSLVTAARTRLDLMAANGTTTVEIKSGYGLDVATERTMLQAIAALDAELTIDLVPTFLGAHAIPPEYAADRDAYVRLVIDQMLPACAPLASCCDVFCDRGAFTVEEARAVLTAARKHGLGLKLHADQLAPSGAAGLAAALGALSADHLDHATDADLAALARSGTVGVLLPGVSLSQRLPYPDAARFATAGVEVAIATDANPGTSYVLTMPFVIALAVLELGMSPAAALRAGTLGGARALGLDDRGHLKPGAIGDLVVLEADTHLDLSYRPDTPHIRHVVKAGRQLAAGGK